MFEIKAEQPLAGETKRFIIKTSDKEKRPLDPMAIEVDFKKPDGLTEKKTMSDMNKLADGEWELYYTLDQAGTWTIKVTVTGWAREKEIEMDSIVVLPSTL
jgi:nitrogen fixation protein FixH